MKIKQKGVRKQNIHQGIYIYQSKGGLEGVSLEPAVIITALFFQIQITIGELQLALDSRSTILHVHKHVRNKLHHK